MPRGPGRSGMPHPEIKRTRSNRWKTRIFFMQVSQYFIISISLSPFKILMLLIHYFNVYAIFVPEFT
jgi:hypothetical protein